MHSARWGLSQASGNAYKTSWERTTQTQSSMTGPLRYLSNCVLKHAPQAWFSLTFAKELFDHCHSETNSVTLERVDLQKDATDIVVAAYEYSTEFQVARLGEVAKDPSIYTHWRSEPDPTMMGYGFDSNGTPFEEARILRFVDSTMLVGLYHHLAPRRGTGILKSITIRSTGLDRTGTSIWP